MNARRIAAATLLAAAPFALTIPAHATDHGQTTTRAWYLPAGVDPHTAPLRDWFPQTVAADPCSWQQVDTYWYGAWAKPIVDALDDDDLLTFDGQPEDSRVYKSHRFVPPAKDCTKPEPTPSPTPTVTTPAPTPTVTTPEPTPTTTSPEPTPTQSTPAPSSTPTATQTLPQSPSPTVTPTTPQTASSTVSPSPARPRLVQTDTPDELAATGPSDVGGLLALGVVLVAGGSALVASRRRGGHQ